MAYRLYILTSLLGRLTPHATAFLSRTNEPKPRLAKVSCLIQGQHLRCHFGDGGPKQDVVCAATGYPFEGAPANNKRRMYHALSTPLTPQQARRRGEGATTRPRHIQGRDRRRDLLDISDGGLADQALAPPASHAPTPFPSASG